MIDKKEFERIKKDLAGFEKKREEVITTSRKIISASKTAIYAVQRDDLKEAEKSLKQMKTLIRSLPREAYDANIQKVAKQEYVEAACFFSLAKSGKIPTAKELHVDDEDFLAGLCDLTGEVVRKSVLDSIKQKYETVRRMHSFVDELYGLIMQLDLRNGELRKKSDSIKWNLKKLDELMYDISRK
ncbi:MAG: hypothetical protein ABIF10_01440 [Candidatus Woesearchaeota archaeon]